MKLILTSSSIKNTGIANALVECHPITRASR